MCDHSAKISGWNGWRPPAQSVPFKATGEWVDLSHPMSPDMPRVPFFPKPIFELIMRMPEKPLNVTRMEMVVHIGTHIDSPRHLFLDGPALEDVPVGRLGGRGVVWPVEIGALEPVKLHHLEGLSDLLRPGDILILDTGWHRHAGTPKYDNEHPYLSVEVAEWILEAGVKLLGVDVPTPEQPVVTRARDFDYPVHRRLLSNGVLISEHLTNLGSLRGVVELCFFALNIVGGDGAPTRVVGRVAA